MNWDTAPQELESLRAQVAALTEDKKSALLNYIDADEQLAMMTEERDKMFAELAAVQARLDAYSWEAENTALRAQVAALTKVCVDLQDKCNNFQNKCRAAQARVRSLHEALWKAHDLLAKMNIPMISDALDTVDDTAALDARLKDEYLKGFSDGAANYATEAIRSMK